MSTDESSACGVGFVSSLKNRAEFSILQEGLRALENLEHRGGTQVDQQTSDGAGVLVDIPHELFGIEVGTAVANLFLPQDPTFRIKALVIFEQVFRELGLEVLRYREPPTDPRVLSAQCQTERPGLIMAFIRRPSQCSTRHSFERLLYTAKQMTRSRLREAGIVQQFFFASLSAGTVVYKALTRSKELSEFYLDLKDPRFKTRFALLHRRFSTNTASSWDKAQPFRLVAHNGEINTIAGNRAWAYARERALGIREDELLTHRNISDSGSVNEMIEALLFRSSMFHLQDILAIMMPQADTSKPFYRFWSRAMEPWDGPALFTYSDGRAIGARLDRSGFRPCRWTRTSDKFYLSSEAGSFEIPETQVVAKGSLSGGSCVDIELFSGRIQFLDASEARENKFANFDPRLKKCGRIEETEPQPNPSPEKLALFGMSEEDFTKILTPMITSAKEPIGSMGDTACLAALSEETRSLYDHFYQNFAQVTNPPLDFIRELIVTDMRVVLGRRPNVFEPKEMLPPKRGLDLDGPVLDLAQMNFLRTLQTESSDSDFGVGVAIFDLCFERELGEAGLMGALDRLEAEARQAVRQKKSVLVLSDRAATFSKPPIPAVLAVARLSRALNSSGMRLKASIVVESGEVRTPHQLSVLVGFGASAVCPYLSLEVARAPHEKWGEIDVASREKNLVSALEQGLLKIISKMGVSVLQSYQGAGLFTILGLGRDVHDNFFPDHRSWMGGMGLEKLVEKILTNTSAEPLSKLRGPSGFVHNYLLREHPQALGGERHSMTARRSKIIHRLLAESPHLDIQSPELLQEYLQSGEEAEPISIRHLLRPRPAPSPLERDLVEDRSAILRRFGSGAMSFGAISAEAQRDIILAMRAIGGRSNSGEGGENPYYYSDGVRAHTKQIASGRFGVTAEYLVTSEEIQIKMAQGAKPGEGGQLMAAKVGPETARARFSEENVDLISPPPMHDIYSIEDLKELIYELRQLAPHSKISVKLVAGDNVGTIAVGVAKAGADIVHISGHDGGTGAATLGSMKHAGLPWEIGLVDAHRALVEQGLRQRVTLRVDGGLSTGRDVVSAALMGAEEFDFGKILLIAEGCVMARICEKNTCPAGIATHNPKFKRLYKGDPKKIVTLLETIAEDVRRELSLLGASSLKEILGRSNLLDIHPAHASRVEALNLDLSAFCKALPIESEKQANPFIEEASALNLSICADVSSAKDSTALLSYSLHSTDRAVLARLTGEIVAQKAKCRSNNTSIDNPVLRFAFHGSAGQGFAAFAQEGLDLQLFGEANDSVAKSMSGGRLVIVPSSDSPLDAPKNTLLGNCALYGATGGILYAYGIAGDRFAIRNSGATAVVEGVGVQACEYMTRGRVAILGNTGSNVGAGMTGGVIYLTRHAALNANPGYVSVEDCNDASTAELKQLLEDYAKATQSKTALSLLDSWESSRHTFVRLVPIQRTALESLVATPELPPGVELR